MYKKNRRVFETQCRHPVIDLREERSFCWPVAGKPRRKRQQHRLVFGKHHVQEVVTSWPRASGALSLCSGTQAPLDGGELF